MYIGAVDGPTMESVIATESPTLLNLGCSETAIAEDMEMEMQETMQGKVEPAKLDVKGVPFVELTLLNGAVVRHDLSKHPSLPKVIQVKTEAGHIGIAEQVALHQWRLKIAPPT